VMSTVLLQRRTPDTYRGRIFSTEWLLFTLAQSVSVMTASVLLENDVFSIRQLLMVFGMGLAVAGICWGWTITRQEQLYQLQKTETAEE